MREGGGEKQVLHYAQDDNPASRSTYSPSFFTSSL
jgi:hypothetical protein